MLATSPRSSGFHLPSTRKQEDWWRPGPSAHRPSCLQLEALSSPKTDEFLLNGTHHWNPPPYSKGSAQQRENNGHSRPLHESNIASVKKAQRPTFVFSASFSTVGCSEYGKSCANFENKRSMEPFQLHSHFDTQAPQVSYTHLPRFQCLEGNSLLFNTFQNIHRFPYISIHSIRFQTFPRIPNAIQPQQASTNVDRNARQEHRLKSDQVSAGRP